ncbi:DUF7935 family protein [Spongiivirga citrea]|uniref:Uncharacterized protein n=1 Tax=Spongiivirga citrea TaxID=1481457 RepID=A0A6M0CH96_9FLAO|nr:hypothetical protein [Spongiivirga citrea]NER16343.1 hypothetical protein [Spongiivirga citrea]
MLLFAEQQGLLEVIKYTVPTIVTGMIAYYFFRLHTKNEDGRRRFLLKKDLQVNALPQRLQAYERMTLFLERIVPSKLLIRVKPNGEDKLAYEALLVNNIETEFEHNLAQQIYMTNECWGVINSAKNATIRLIRTTNMSAKVENADKLREAILSEMLDKQAPSATALSFIKEEISDIW